MKRSECFILSFIFSMLFVNLVNAYAVKLYVDPSSIVDTSLTPDDTFTVDVKIEDAVGLYAYELKLDFNPDILEATDAAIQPFLNDPTMQLTKETDNEEGYVKIAISSYNPAEAVSGDGTLATITFRVKDTGESTLNFEESWLSDIDMKEIPHETENGYFSNTLATTTPTVTTVPSGGGGGGGRVTTTTTTPEETTTTLGEETTTTPEEETTTVEETTTTVEEETKLPTGMFPLIGSNLPYLIVAIVLIVIFIVLIKVKKSS